MKLLFCTYSPVLLLLLVLLFTGCDMFTTRPAEQPESARSNYEVPATPDILVANFKSSVHDKSLEDYMDCFVDSSFSSRRFVFSPSAGSASKYGHLQDWQIQDERQYFNSLISSLSEGSVITLNFTDELMNLYGDSAAFSAGYSMTVPFADESKARFYQGSLRMTLVRDRRLQWAISYWEDTKLNASPTWSELKGSLF